MKIIAFVLQVFYISLARINKSILITVTLSVISVKKIKLSRESLPKEPSSTHLISMRAPKASL